MLQSHFLLFLSSVNKFWIAICDLVHCCYNFDIEIIKYFYFGVAFVDHLYQQLIFVGQVESLSTKQRHANKIDKQ